jgi:hypothetical protein
MSEFLRVCQSKKLGDNAAEISVAFERRECRCCENSLHRKHPIQVIEQNFRCSSFLSVTYRLRQLLLTVRNKQVLQSQEVSAHVYTLFLKKQRKAGEVGSRLLCGRSVFYKLENQGHDLT